MAELVRALEEIKEMVIPAYHADTIEHLSRIQSMQNAIDYYEKRRIKIADKIYEVMK